MSASPSIILHEVAWEVVEGNQYHGAMLVHDPLLLPRYKEAVAARGKLERLTTHDAEPFGVILRWRYTK